MLAGAVIVTLIADAAAAVVWIPVGVPEVASSVVPISISGGCRAFVWLQWDPVSGANEYKVDWTSDGSPQSNTGDASSFAPDTRHQNPPDKLVQGIYAGDTVPCDDAADEAEAESARLVGVAVSVDAIDAGQPPVASFDVTRSGVNSFHFVSTSTDPDNDITTTAWDFGDNATGSGTTIDHTYASPGPFTVELTVTDSGGRTDSTSKSVASVLVVTTTGDQQEAEADRGDNTCDVDGSTDGAQCTLRAAIEESNAGAIHEIAFDIPGGGQPHVAVLADLPELEGTVLVDGTTQPGGEKPAIVSADPSLDGLVLTGAGSTLKGLEITGFRVGVTLRGDGGHKVLGNLVSGMTDVGIQLESSNNEVGSGDARTACGADCNVIGGNGPGDIDLTDQRKGDVVVLGGTGNVIAGNEIDAQQEGFSDSRNDGVVVRAGDGTVIRGNVLSGRVGVLALAEVTIEANLIGIDRVGGPIAPSEPGNLTAEGKGFVGIWAHTNYVVVGGDTAADGNVIAGWTRGGAEAGVTGSGVLIDAPGVIVRHNRIGTDQSGLQPVPNRVGVSTEPGAQGARIEDNLISGNETVGVENLHDTNATIAGNRIGTDVSGTDVIGNRIGVVSVGLVGGPRAEGSTTCDSPCNLITGNETGVVAKAVQGNFIGTTLSGAGSLGNLSGVEALPSEAIEVGGPSGAIPAGVCDRLCNLIAFNHDQGIVVRDLSTANIRGNVIRENGGPGIVVQTPGPTNIGSDDGSFDGNVIEHNRGPGVEVRGANDVTILNNTITANDAEGVLIADDPATFGVKVSRNSIFDNGKLGIDLSTTGLGQSGDGPTPNVSGGPDGPNHFQPWPRINVATVTGDALRVTGKMDFFHLSATLLHVEFYVSRTCDSSGFGEGEIYLGSDETAAAATGRISAVLPLPPDGYGFVTATATTVDGSTSEFSPCKPLQLGTTLTEHANAGDKELEVASTNGFQVGDHIVVGPGTDHEEHTVVTGFGSLIVDPAVQIDHAVGELVVLEARPATSALARTGTEPSSLVWTALLLIAIGVALQSPQRLRRRQSGRSRP